MDRLTDSDLADLDGALRFVGPTLLGSMNERLLSLLREVRERRDADLTRFDPCLSG